MGCLGPCWFGEGVRRSLRATITLPFRSTTWRVHPVWRFRRRGWNLSLLQLDKPTLNLAVKGKSRRPFTVTKLVGKRRQDDGVVLVAGEQLPQLIKPAAKVRPLGRCQEFPPRSNNTTAPRQQRQQVNAGRAQAVERSGVQRRAERA